ncbi:general stress protein [Brachybacterium sp. GU-2]|uniref:general stress protein n=1 Tax=Brachybacterium sp. GU-2 TaxID=3069708 RepID=UPI00280AD9A8|nr:general stress protein [Brachybacterium sp. GU-2]WME22070.1 general stress protein [Brachybacterium sp. GU-2]
MTQKPPESTQSTEPTQTAQPAQAPQTAQATQTHAAEQPEPTTDPSMATLATYPDYMGAQEAVDLLSDKGYDVAAVRIVGHGLKSVELVTGRMTWGKAALYGAGGGAWLGLMLGLLLAIFVPLAFVGPVLSGIVFGAVWGVIFGLIGFAATGNRRNFRSQRITQATSYSVEVPSDRLAAAQQILAAGR